MELPEIDWQPLDAKRDNLMIDMALQPHLLIAGSTGSGKSVLINSIIYNLLTYKPGQVRLILIDPKRVELNLYKELPHTIRHVTEPKQIYYALNHAVNCMELRYQDMEKKQLRKYDGNHMFIIIDEFADLMVTQKKQVLPLIIRIAQLGRAANVHLIIATQRPTKDIITGEIKVNIDARVALRCPTSQDSRNIINVAGAENLPTFGYAYYLRTPHQPELYEIPLTTDEDIKERINYWCKQMTPKFIRIRNKIMKRNNYLINNAPYPL